MYLIEKHIINSNHSLYNECDRLCFLSKNIYNQALYNVRQHFFQTKQYLNYNSNYHVTKEQECYSYLPTKVFCQTVKMVDKNFKSFFALLKNKTVKNKLPKYLDITKGRYLTIFPKQALGLREFKRSGKVHLSKTDIYVNTKVSDFNLIKEVRIVPRLRQYVIEIVYFKQEKEIKDNNIVASIDLGLNNLATVTYNNGDSPQIINGRPLKSINQYFNKNKAHYQSKFQGNQKNSRRISNLTNKRNNKINDYLHKASRELVNQLVSKGISTLVIGKNANMKQDINLGKVNNQNFVQLPIMRFADMVKYKCELEGINVIFHEESYTSKCSFLDNEEICKHEAYLGKRVKRGLFKSTQGYFINADVNGSYNIMRKAVPNAFVNGIEGLGVNPIVLTIKK